MSQNLPFEKPATKQELLEHPERWEIAHVGLYSVTYKDGRGRHLMILHEDEHPAPAVEENIPEGVGE